MSELLATYPNTIPARISGCGRGPGTLLHCQRDCSADISCGAYRVSVRRNPRLSTSTNQTVHKPRAKPFLCHTPRRKGSLLAEEAVQGVSLPQLLRSWKLSQGCSLPAKLSPMTTVTQFLLHTSRATSTRPSARVQSIAVICA